MKSTSNMTLVLGCLALLVFGVGLWQLFAIRLAVGDVYPPYSSLRADPLGSRALYESLDTIQNVRVGRLYEPIERAGNPNGTTLFWLGDEFSQRPNPEWREFVHGGGRLVIGWSPSRFVERSTTNAPGPFPWQQSRAQPTPLVPREALSQEPKDVAFRDDWGVDVQFRPLQDSDGENGSQPARRVTELDLPGEIAWHTTICLTNLAPEWTTIYERQSQPVVVERAFGRGSVVITTDSYPFSNEALRSDRHTDFLLWASGSNRRILFDERHLGVESTQGIAGLMRHYRLHALVGGVFVLVMLFLWRSMTSFLPRTEYRGRRGDAADDGAIEGHDLATGFVRLLHRGIRKRDILQTCFLEWKESQATGQQCSKERLTRMEQAMMSYRDTPMNDREIVTAYRDLHKIWKQ